MVMKGDIMSQMYVPTNRHGGKNSSLWGKGGLSPFAIVEGNVRDSSFLSAASAVAETPSRITSLFKNTEYPKNGALEIYFHIGGKR